MKKQSFWPFLVTEDDEEALPGSCLQGHTPTNNIKSTKCSLDISHLLAFTLAHNIIKVREVFFFFSFTCFTNLSAGPGIIIIIFLGKSEILLAFIIQEIYSKYRDLFEYK